MFLLHSEEYGLDGFSYSVDLKATYNSHTRSFYKLEIELNFWNSLLEVFILEPPNLSHEIQWIQSQVIVPCKVM